MATEADATPRLRLVPSEPHNMPMHNASKPTKPTKFLNKLQKNILDKIITPSWIEEALVSELSSLSPHPHPY